MYHLLRLEGDRWNHKRVYRVYVMMGLNIGRKRKRRLPARVKTPHILAIQSDITWSGDFMHDSLSNGRPFSTFNVIDDHNREDLMITIDTFIKCWRITRELDRLIEWRGTPEVIRVDNGQEFTSAVFEVWTRKHKIKLCFIQLGKPTQNTPVERFNGSYTIMPIYSPIIEQVRDQTQQWIWDYNNIRPHESLGNKPPVTFLKQRGVTVPSLNVDMHLKEKTICTNASV